MIAPSAELDFPFSNGGITGELHVPPCFFCLAHSQDFNHFQPSLRKTLLRRLLDQAVFDPCLGIH